MNKPFRDRSSAPRLTREQAERQGRVARLAFEALGRPEQARIFLNTHSAELGGRPIDLAIASDEDLQRVEQAISLIGT